MDEPVVAPEVVAIRMFVQNNVYELPNVHIMPIGIRDCGTIVAMHAGMYEQTAPHASRETAQVPPVLQPRHARVPAARATMRSAAFRSFST